MLLRATRKPANEECDDGNTVDNDECTNTCQIARCGDGAVQLGEACDDGNTINTDGCTALCTVAFCGDGIIQLGVDECDNDVNDGSYGTCKKCGEDIGQARLEAMPEATRCVNCAS